jgi:tetratricopeptide (TPR) repeat protein
MQEQSDQPADPKVAKAELVRLRIKRSETSDEDIRRALDERIAQLEAQVPAPEPEPEIEIPSEPPTPAQLEEADQLIRQARVEKMRGNARAATDLLKKAVEVAPGAPVVLETLADDLIERKLYGEAQKILKRAVKLDPRNVGLERKFAMTVATTANLGSLEDQMRANLSDSFVGGPDARASGNAALLLSAILPGLGHVVLGRAVGFIIMASWVLCGIWVIYLREDFKGLVTLAAGQGRTPNLTVMVPLFIMVLLYFGSLASLQSARRTVAKRRVDRPVPPVDKPFEL